MHNYISCTIHLLSTYGFLPLYYGLFHLCPKHTLYMPLYFSQLQEPPRGWIGQTPLPQFLTWDFVGDSFVVNLRGCTRWVFFLLRACGILSFFCLLIGEGELEKIESLDVKISLELSQAGTHWSCCISICHNMMPPSLKHMWPTSKRQVEEKMRQYEKDLHHSGSILKRMGDWKCLIYLVVHDRSNERPDHTCCYMDRDPFCKSVSY